MQVHHLSPTQSTQPSPPILPELVPTLFYLPTLPNPCFPSALSKVFSLSTLNLFPLHKLSILSHLSSNKFYSPNIYLIPSLQEFSQLNITRKVVLYFPNIVYPQFRQLYLENNSGDNTATSFPNNQSEFRIAFSKFIAIV